MLEEGHHSNRTASGGHMELDLFRLRGCLLQLGIHYAHSYWGKKDGGQASLYLLD